ncbi:MAG: WD40/YVTN/BNR-like repeat-containing protein [Pyrinomonadaceae bacterium]
MPEPKHVMTTPGDVMLLAGTMKGAFVLRSDKTRQNWEVGGPYFPGRAIYALAYDDRKGRHRLWAAVNSSYWGSYLSSSDDFGKIWTEPETYGVKFPESADAAVKQIWQIAMGHADEPDTLYCGVEPAALFKSTDAGESWSLVEGLYNHPHREQWMPGGGGLCLHTILLDPSDKKRLFVAISTGGVYRSDDGGEIWQARNVGVRAQFLPPEQRYPEFGQCVHKIVSDPSDPRKMFLQNHWGLYKSEDCGDSWTDIANGVPSDFGFALEVDPNDSSVFIVPLESDEFRCTPEGKLRVYRTRDGGKSWTATHAGLPQENALETVLRDALSADSLKPAGIYFGTRSGKLFGSRDSGDSWNTILESLPPVVCVKTALVQ